MCRLASFVYKFNDVTREIDVVTHGDLQSHSELQRATGKTEAAGYCAGHYLPSGEIECRTIEGRNIAAEEEIKAKWTRFVDFFNERMPQSVGGSLDLSGCDLKGVKLPQSVGGSLYLRDCDLKGVKLPQSVGGSLDLDGCDLKGLKLPQSVGGWLYLRGCDLKGVDGLEKYDVIK